MFSCGDVQELMTNKISLTAEYPATYMLLYEIEARRHYSLDQPLTGISGV